MWLFIDVIPATLTRRRSAEYDSGGKAGKRFNETIRCARRKVFGDF